MSIDLIVPEYLFFWWINMFLIHNKEGIRTSIKIQINIFFDNKIKDCSVGSSPSLLWWYPMRHLQKKKKKKGWLSVICWKCIIRRGELKNQSGVGVNLTPTHTFLYKNKSFTFFFFTQIYLNCVTTLFMGHIHEMGGTLKGWAEFRVK